MGNATKSNDKKQRVAATTIAPNISVYFLFTALGKGFKLTAPCKISAVEVNDDGTPTGRGGNPWFEGEHNIVIAANDEDAAIIGETEHVDFVSDLSDRAIVESFKAKYDDVLLQASEKGAITKTPPKEVFGGKLKAGGNWKTTVAMGESVHVEELDRSYVASVTAMCLRKHETKNRPAFRVLNISAKLTNMAPPREPKPLRFVGSVEEVPAF